MSAAATPAQASSRSQPTARSRAMPSTTRLGTSLDSCIRARCTSPAPRSARPAWNGQITDVAFRNPDGSTVLVVHNENDNPSSFSVSENGQSFDYTLPGGALATYVWPHPPTPAPAETALDPYGWSATANPTGPTDQCCTDDVASHAVDDDATTRWSTGAAQAPGQYLQVDLGRPLRGDAGSCSTPERAPATTRAVTRSAPVPTERPGPPRARAPAPGQLTSIALDGSAVGTSRSR